MRGDVAKAEGAEDPVPGQRLRSLRVLVDRSRHEDQIDEGEEDQDRRSPPPGRVALGRSPLRFGRRGRSDVGTHVFPAYWERLAHAAPVSCR